MTVSPITKQNKLQQEEHNLYPFKYLKGIRPLRGYFGPLSSQKLKVAFHQYHLIGLLEG